MQSPSPKPLYDSLASTCLALSIVELVFCGQRIVSSALGGVQMRLPSGMPGKGLGEAELDRMKGLLGGAMMKMAVWESVRMIPFAAATGVLLWIAIRLRRGDATALAAARRWPIAAFAALAASLAIQLVVTVPLTLEMMRRFFASTGGPPSTSGDQFLETAGLVMLLGSTAGGALVMSVWPVVLLVWSGRVMRRMAADAS